MLLSYLGGMLPCAFLGLGMWATRHGIFLLQSPDFRKDACVPQARSVVRCLSSTICGPRTRDTSTCRLNIDLLQKNQAEKLRELYWKGGESDANAFTFFEDTPRYLYMPRFKTRDVLARAIQAGAASKDFFGVAYGKTDGKFEGFALGGGSVVFDDTLLLIEPAAAPAYEEAKRPQPQPGGTGSNRGNRDRLRPGLSPPSRAANRQRGARRKPNPSSARRIFRPRQRRCDWYRSPTRSCPSLPPIPTPTFA
jgi:hypothetical protein